MIASGQSRGIRGDAYYGYRDDLLEAVIATFRRYGLAPEQSGVTFVRGLYEESLHPAGPVALAHIDCDWYDSVMVCLERIEPLLVPGGVLIIDDYFDWSGCRKAVDDYFADKRDQFRFEPRTSLHIHKLP